MASPTKYDLVASVVKSGSHFYCGVKKVAQPSSKTVPPSDSFQTSRARAQVSPVIPRHAALVRVSKTSDAVMCRAYFKVRARRDWRFFLKRWVTLPGSSARRGDATVGPGQDASCWRIGAGCRSCEPLPCRAG